MHQLIKVKIVLYGITLIVTMTLQCVFLYPMLNNSASNIKLDSVVAFLLSLEKREEISKLSMYFRIT